MLINNTPLGPDGGLLSNPGFETGTLAPWLGGGIAGVASHDPHTGTYHGFIDPSAAESSLYQQVTAPSSGSYTFEAYVATGNLPYVGIGITVDGMTVDFVWVSGSAYAAVRGDGPDSLRRSNRRRVSVG